jgi:hypothetical protein
MRNEIGSLEESQIAKNSAGGRKEVRLSREEGNGFEKAREWLTFMEWSVENVSHRKPHDIIISAHKSSPRESQSSRGLRAM